MFFPKSSLNSNYYQSFCYRSTFSLHFSLSLSFWCSYMLVVVHRSNNFTFTHRNIGSLSLFNSKTNWIWPEFCWWKKSIFSVQQTYRIARTLTLLSNACIFVSTISLVVGGGRWFVYANTNHLQRAYFASLLRTTNRVFLLFPFCCLVFIFAYIAQRCGK